jgi:hypothetical protein
MADVDWDKVAWDEPNEGGDEETQAKTRYQKQFWQLREPRMGDAAAWDEPTQSTPVEDIRKVEDGAAAFARWKEEEQEKVAAAMAHAIQQQTTAPVSDPARLVVGDYVRVKDGSFRGWHGLVTAVLKDSNQVRAKLLPFHGAGCLLTMNLEYWQVERVCPPDSVATCKAEQRPLPEEVKKVVQWADRHGCLEDTVPGHAEWAQREGVFWEVAKSVQVTEEQVAALPLAEVHPANEGPYLLDEQGNVRTLKATAHPESLHIQVGNLEVYCEGEPGVAALPVSGSTIFVDGKPFPVKSLVLRGNVDGLWTVEMEFYPRQPKE